VVRQALVAVSSAVSTALQAAALWWWRAAAGGGGGSAVRTPLTLPCGPYGLLFALLVQYVCDVPAGSHFSVAGMQARTPACTSFSCWACFCYFTQDTWEGCIIPAILTTLVLPLESGGTSVLCELR
jgi:hypothetical protein